jgi:hypothetical protein
VDLESAEAVHHAWRPDDCSNSPEFGCLMAQILYESSIAQAATIMSALGGLRALQRKHRQPVLRGSLQLRPWATFVTFRGAILY